MRRIIMASITAVVVIAVLAGTLIPVLDDATATSKTYENEGYFNVSVIGTDTDVTIAWDPADPYVITVGSDELDFSGLPTDLPVSIIGSDSAIIRFVIASGGTASIYYNGTGGQKILTSAGTDTASIVISSSSIVATLGSVTRTASITAGFYADPNGDYLMKDKDVDAYVSSETLIFAGSTTVASNTPIFVYGSGNISDGMTVTEILGNTDYTVGDVTINYSETDCVDTYLLESFVFDITAVDDESVTTATYTYFVIPSEVTAEKIVHFTDGENAIFNVIPVIVIIALLLAVVALVLRSRMD